MSSAGPAVVDISGIEKRFGSTLALRGVDLSIAAGQCLGLVGRNGAGKSTIVSILSGLIEPDAGMIRFGGTAAPRIGDVRLWRKWIATVFQHSMVVPDLSVAENVFLGGTDRFVSWRAMRARTREIMRDWGFDIAADALCRTLTVEQLQIVEIARALARGAKCVLLDEPTAALERDGARRLFERVKQLIDGGVAVLYISHHLEEVFEICQDVAVLRDGELVLTAPVPGLSRDDLIAAMVGSTASPSAASPASKSGSITSEPLLEVENLTARSPLGRLGGVSLSVRPGEIVGVTGLLSAGVATVGRVVAGADGYDSGQIRLSRQPVPAGRRDKAQLAGIGYIPEDRRTEGFVAQLGVAENVTMTITDRLAGPLGLLRPRARMAAAVPITARLSVVAASLSQPVAELSGGNQQKVTVARTLARDPRLIVALTPTRGVDVAAKALLLATLSSVARERDAGVLLCTDDLSDLVICDRVIVLVRGEVAAEFTAPVDRDQLIVSIEGLSGQSGPTADGGAQ